MKRKKKITHERWAIARGPDYPPIVFGCTRKGAIHEFCGDPEKLGKWYKPWKHWYRKGLRAVKVQVSYEIEGG